MLSQEDKVRLTIYLEMREEIDQEELHHLIQLLKKNLEDFSVELVPPLQVDCKSEPGEKGLDLSLLAPVVVVMLPIVLPKLLDFLQAWTLRDQNRVIKIRAELKDRSIEAEYPPMLPDEAQKHIEMIMNTLRADKKKP